MNNMTEFPGIMALSMLRPNGETLPSSVVV